MGRSYGQISKHTCSSTCIRNRTCHMSHFTSKPRSNSPVTPIFSQDMPAKVASEQSWLETISFYQRFTHISHSFTQFLRVSFLINYIELRCPSLIFNGQKRTKRTQHLPQPAQKTQPCTTPSFQKHLDILHMTRVCGMSQQIADPHISSKMA